MRNKLRAVGAVDNRQTGFNIQRQPLLAIVKLRFAAQGIGDAGGGCRIGHQQEALGRMLKPQHAGSAFADHLFLGVRQFAQQRRQRGARLETGNAQQHGFIIGGDRHLREHRVLFQFGQLRITQAAAFNPCKTLIAAENAQVAPHLALGVTVRGKQMLLVGQVADVGGDLPLQIFFAIRTGNRRQRPVVQRHQR